CVFCAADRKCRVRTPDVRAATRAEHEIHAARLRPPQAEVMTKKPEGIKAIEDRVAHCYSTWGESYYNDYYGPNAPYPPVHRDLLVSLVEAHGAKRVIDAGCGPASILRHIA